MSMSQTQFWNDIEETPWSQVSAMQEEKLLRQLDYLLQNSPFYQRKFAEAGLTRNDIKSVRDLEKVPFTAKAEIRESLREAPPLGLHVAAPMSEIIQIQSSSGTTGTPTYVAATKHDLHVWCEMGARVFFANGFRPGDVCLHAYAMSRGFVGGLVNVQILQYMGVCEIPIGAEAGTERLLRTARDLSPIAMCSTPSLVTYLGERAEAVLGIPAAELSIQKISVGGEPGGGIPHVRARMEQLWDADVRDMMGGADFGSTYWAECEYKDGMHHCAQEFLLVEIIDPATGESLPIQEGTEGELVYTAIDREASPLLRYRMGDRVVVVAMGCPCGRTGYKIKCLGRTDDMLIYRGVNVFPSAVKDVITSMIPRTTGLMKIVVDFPGHATDQPLKIKVEYGTSVRPQELPQLKRALESRLKELLNFRADVQLIPPDTLEKPGSKKEVLIERIAESGS